VCVVSVCNFVLDSAKPYDVKFAMRLFSRQVFGVD